MSPKHGAPVEGIPIVPLPQDAVCQTYGDMRAWVRILDTD